MIPRLPGIVVTVAALALLTGAVAVPVATDDYEVTAVLPRSHPKLAEGTPIFVDGFETGKIVSLRPENNKAVVTLHLDDEAAPLHSGATLRLKWKSLVGERLLYVQDGPAQNPPIPDGGRIEGDHPASTEVGDILAKLDPETRKHLGSLAGRLEGTFDGQENTLRATLTTAGPALSALGEVLRAVGSDGPAIRSLVINLNQMMSQIENRSGDTQQAISSLSRLVNTVAGEREQLQRALAKLPGVLQVSQSALAEVPDTADAAIPLVKDLASATERLPSAATNLAAVFRELRPAVADLKPTLQSASVLLDHTPALFDSLHATVPDMTDAARGYLPAMEALRPYTPEAVHFLTTWGLAARNYDANGRYMRIQAQTGGTAFNANPGIPIPGVSQDLTPEPGAPAGIPQDAEGEGMN